MSTEVTIISDSFQKGMRHVAVKDVPTVKAKLMHFFGVTSEPAWLRWLRGENTLTREKAKGVELIFRKFNVVKSNVWGE